MTLQATRIQIVLLLLFNIQALSTDIPQTTTERYKDRAASLANCFAVRCAICGRGLANFGYGSLASSSSIACAYSFNACGDESNEAGCGAACTWCIGLGLVFPFCALGGLGSTVGRSFDACVGKPLCSQAGRRLARFYDNCCEDSLSCPYTICAENEEFDAVYCFEQRTYRSRMRRVNERTRLIAAAPIIQEPMSITRRASLLAICVSVTSLMNRKPRTTKTTARQSLLQRCGWLTRSESDKWKRNNSPFPLNHADQALFQEQRLPIANIARYLIKAADLEYLDEGIATHQPLSIQETSRTLFYSIVETVSDEVPYIFAHEESEELLNEWFTAAQINVELIKQYTEKVLNDARITSSSSARLYSSIVLYDRAKELINEKQ